MKRSYGILTLVAVLALAGSLQTARAQVPARISYQGLVLDQNQASLADAPNSRVGETGANLNLIPVVASDPFGRPGPRQSSSKNAIVRTSMLSRGAAPSGVLGSSNEVCAVKRARPSVLDS